MSKIPVTSKSPKSSTVVAMVTNNDLSDDEDSLTNKAPINPDIAIGRLKKLLSDKTNFRSKCINGNIRNGTRC